MEYANTIWGPHFLLDQGIQERVQHCICATKLVATLATFMKF